MWRARVCAWKMTDWVISPPVLGECNMLKVKYEELLGRWTNTEDQATAAYCLLEGLIQLCLARQETSGRGRTKFLEALESLQFTISRPHDRKNCLW